MQIMHLEKILKMENIPKLLICAVIVAAVYLVLRNRKKLLDAFRKALNGIKACLKWAWTKAKALACIISGWVQCGVKSILAFAKKVLCWVIAGIKRVIGRVKEICIKVCHFFRDKKMLLFVIAADAVYIGVCGAMHFRGRPLPPSMVIWPLIVSPMWLLVFYGERFFAWCNRGHIVIEKAVSLFFSVLGVLSPALSFFALMNTSKLYFTDSLEWYGVVIIGASILFQGLMVVYYCYELRDVNAARFSLKFRIQYFLFIVIHLIQIFANIYILLLILDHGSISGISAGSPFALSWDLTFFSAMTFLGRDGLLKPESEWAKLVVLIQSFIFTIYISIVILGILSGNQANGKNNNE